MANVSHLESKGRFHLSVMSALPSRKVGLDSIREQMTVQPTAHEKARLPAGGRKTAWGSGSPDVGAH